MLAGFDIDILNTAKDKKRRSGDRDGAAANSANIYELHKPATDGGRGGADAAGEEKGAKEKDS
jgi:hypothetical protein